MKKAILTLLAVCTLGLAMAQTPKCGIDTKALTQEEIQAGATSIRFLAKMAHGFNPKTLETAGIKIGAQAGQIVTLTVPVESLDVLENNKDILQYSIAHRVAQPMCDHTRVDTRTDSVQKGLGVTGDTNFKGTGVYIGITDWGFDYTHPNIATPLGAPRTARAWDHFRTAGPAPNGFDYGTELIGADQLTAAQGDTSNIYGYGTHGTHVAGIAGGRGHAGRYVGQAPKAEFLLCSFGINEAAWMDGVQWMRNVAQQDGRRLVVNSSWGMYSFSTLDGTSLLDQAIDNWSAEGIIFCTSAGNNYGDGFHISKTFRADTVDTLRTIATYYTYAADAIGQALIMWGEEGNDFTARFRMKRGGTVWSSPDFSTAAGDQIIYDTLVCDTILIPYRALIEHANPFDNRPHIQLDVNRDLALQLQLYITAESGTVHAWNVANKKNHAGNEGAPFESGNDSLFTRGNSLYSISEPAVAHRCITVAAHSADRWNSSHTKYSVGRLASFSSSGPVIDGRQKPDISAPGVDVVSSISAWTDDSYSAIASESNMTATYIWSKMSGTSMSSPAATGVVALMLQANPGISAEQVYDIVTRTARNDTVTGPLHAHDSADLRWGWGKIDALKAVNEAIRIIGIQAAEEMQLPLHVFPNPANETVTVNTNCGETQTLTILNIDGRKVAEIPVTTQTNINIGDWPRGVYILRCGSRTEKLIVK
ncbi:MAG: S8 family peptidase [Bacteroidales bacterium]|nr:S8 family peptidase [Bacteroidales bacterium]